MVKHIHRLESTCKCRMDADEPHAKCPIHSGYTERRCCICGQFISWQMLEHLTIKQTMDLTGYVV